MCACVSTHDVTLYRLYTMYMYVAIHKRVMIMVGAHIIKLTKNLWSVHYAWSSHGGSQCIASWLPSSLELEFLGIFLLKKTDTTSLEAPSACDAPGYRLPCAHITLYIHSMIGHVCNLHIHPAQCILWVENDKHWCREWHQYKESCGRTFGKVVCCALFTLWLK